MLPLSFSPLCSDESLCSGGFNRRILYLYQLLKVAETSPGNGIAVSLQMLAYNLYVSLLFRIGISRGDKKA